MAKRENAKYAEKIVGKNKMGICSACKNRVGDRGVKVMEIFALTIGVVFTGINTFTKKD